MVFLKPTLLAKVCQNFNCLDIQRYKFCNQEIYYYLILGCNKLMKKKCFCLCKLLAQNNNILDSPKMLNTTGERINWAAVDLKGRKSGHGQLNSFPTVFFSSSKLYPHWVFPFETLLFSVDIVGLGWIVNFKKKKNPAQSKAGGRWFNVSWFSRLMHNIVC